MATSGAYNFSMTRDDLIKASLRKIRVLKRGFTPDALDISEASTALNGIVSQLREKSDGAPSLKMWTRKRLVLFLQSAQYEYDLGPSGDHACLLDDLVQTTIKTAEASGQTVLTLTSNSGMAVSDYAGIVLDSGAIHWTTISAVDGGGEDITVDDALTDDAAAGNIVYTYTTKPQNPVRILFVNRRDSDGNDTPMGLWDLDDYAEIGDKDASGTPANIYAQRGRDATILYMDQAADDVTETVRLWVHYPIESFDATDDNPDFPEQWYWCLVWMLALDLAPEYDVTFSQTDMMAAERAMRVAANSDPETSDIFFEPDRCD